jgi:asparagine synthase (glutamine-hydrolysing)
MQINLTGDKWEKHGDVYGRGRVFVGVNVVSLQQILQELATCNQVADVTSYANTLRGDFSFVINKPNLHCLVVSHTRLYPLFYRWQDEQWWVSDKPSNLLSKGDVVSETAHRQYLYTGAPFAGNTLVANIKQGKPSYVTSFEGSQSLAYLFGPYDVMPKKILEDDLKKTSFDRVLKLLSERMQHAIGDRQVVVPLSGGYDSRLVLSLLYKMGIKKILCYTVGKGDPSEQQVARQVASKLQVPLIHIDYREEQYRVQDYASAAFADYVDTMGAFTNFMWLYEYNAILWLKQHALLQEDAIFIPGHVGDFFAGSHLQKLGIEEDSSLRSIRYKLLLHAFEYQKPCFDALFRSDLKGYLQAMPPRDQAYLTALQFICENRLAHQILNSARVYECLGYDVLLPLCDVDFVRFFLQLPYSELSQVTFYNNYLMNHIFTPLAIDFEKKKSPKQYKWQRIKNGLKLLVPRSWFLRFKKRNSITTEVYLLNEMLEEMIQEGTASKSSDYINGNELMLTWYLKRVEKQIGF